MTKSRIVIAAIATAAFGAGIGAYLLTASGSAATPPAASEEGGTTTTSLPDTDLSLTVDESLAPVIPTVGGLEDGDDPRPVGRIMFSDGETTDLVLGELIVATRDDSQLQGFLERNDGELLDTFPGENGEPDEHLVRVPLKDVDPAKAAAAVAEVEEDHAGEYAVSDPMLLAMMDIAATEQLEHGIEVSLNWLATPTDIADGDIEDADDRSNPLTWSYLKVGGELDTGVAGAWQLLEHYDRSDFDVHVMIADGGFFENADFPWQRKIRLAGWNEANPMTCTGGSSCPTHGTDVAVTAVGQIDNGYGTAGVAGQVGVLIAVEADHDHWTKMRNIKKVARQEHPAVINMSFGTTVKAFRAASQASSDRHIKAMKDTGALVITSAGNDGKDVDGKACVFSRCYENRLILPCESKYAKCIGGYQTNSPWLHENSNRGTAGGSRSVEMYAPFCVVVPFNPVNSGVKDTEWTCGTSFSAPFVAGAAALVKAADPYLGPDEIWDILVDTAHVGGVHFDHYIPTEHQRRINVLDAVAAALGVEQAAPRVDITSPDSGDEFGLEDWFDLEGTAIDFKGEPLEITWTSSIDGHLGTSMDTVAAFELTPGSHTITASATDVNGSAGTDSITVEVVDAPPEMEISWPAPGSLVYETEQLTLVGSSYDPDTYQSLGDGQVEWEITRNGNLVYRTNGHFATVAPGSLQPGSYRIALRGEDGGGVGETSIDIQMLEVIGELPVAHITTVFEDEYSAYNGEGPEVTLTGVGSDAEDGPLSGTRFRWIARAENGHQEVLCTGSSFAEAEAPQDEEFDPGFVATPGDSDGDIDDFAAVVDCSSVDFTLDLAPGTGNLTVWAIILEVVDSDGQVGRDIAETRVGFVTG